MKATVAECVAVREGINARLLEAAEAGADPIELRAWSEMLGTAIRIEKGAVEAALAAA